jgi:hypothetical protein
MSGLNYKSSLNDNMIEISKTLESLKTNRSVVEREIDNEELYKSKLIEKIKNYQNEVSKIIGIEI